MLCEKIYTKTKSLNIFKFEDRKKTLITEQKYLQEQHNWSTMISLDHSLSPLFPSRNSGYIIDEHSIRKIQNIDYGYVFKL